MQHLKPNLKSKFLPFFIIFFGSLSFFAGLNQALALPRAGSQGQTRIRSDIIDISRKSNTINFLKNVVVEKDDSSLLASKMTVFYKENLDSDFDVKLQKQPKKNAKIERIEARENVKIFSKEFIASGDFGYYDPKKNIFVLEKNVIVNNGTSIASGYKFVYNIKTKKGVFVGPSDETSIRGSNDKRVIVVIGEDAKDQDKETKK